MLGYSLANVVLLQMRGAVVLEMDTPGGVLRPMREYPGSVRRNNLNLEKCILRVFYGEDMKDEGMKDE